MDPRRHEERSQRRHRDAVVHGLLAATILAFAAGCGPDAESTTPPPPPGGCQPGEAPSQSGDGSCVPAGVPPDACPAGFAAEAGGCTAILPAEPCAEGLLAVPGETECRELRACGAAPYGDVPTDGPIAYVDGAYSGGASDGTTERPWTTIQEGIDAVPAGATVAIAAGSYAGGLLVTGRAVQLWGRCPALVEVVGSSAAPALRFGPGADGSRASGLGIRGTGIGIRVAGAADVLLEQLWIHATGGHGIEVTWGTGPTAVSLDQSILESTGAVGLLAVGGVTLGISRTAVRDTRPDGTGNFGRGIVVLADPSTNARPTATVQSCVLERNVEEAIDLAGADATIEATVMRDTLPRETDGDLGVGLMARADPDSGERANMTLRGSVIERCSYAGLFVMGSDAVVETTTIRDLLPRPDQYFGRGIGVEFAPYAGAAASLELRSSLVERSFDAAISFAGATGVIEQTWVRDTSPEAATGLFGYGVSSCAYPGTDAPAATLELRNSVVERSRGVGVHVAGVGLQMAATRISDTESAQADGLSGRGLNVQNDGPTGQRALASVSGSLVERSRDAGIAVIGSDATIEGTVVQNVSARAQDGLYGDGIVLWAYLDPASGTIRSSRVDTTARAGIASFGGTVALESTAVQCALIPLDGETFDGVPATFEDQEGNQCGCEGSDGPCQISTTGLAPPEPLP